MCDTSSTSRLSNHQIERIGEVLAEISANSIFVPLKSGNNSEEKKVKQIVALYEFGLTSDEKTNAIEQESKKSTAKRLLSTNGEMGAYRAVSGEAGLREMQGSEYALTTIDPEGMEHFCEAVFDSHSLLGHMEINLGSASMSPEGKSRPANIRQPPSTDTDRHGIAPTQTRVRARFGMERPTLRKDEGTPRKSKSKTTNSTAESNFNLETSDRLYRDSKTSSAMPKGKRSSIPMPKRRAQTLDSPTDKHKSARRNNKATKMDNPNATKTEVSDLSPRSKAVAPMLRTAERAEMRQLRQKLSIPNLRSPPSKGSLKKLRSPSPKKDQISHLDATREIPVHASAPYEPKLQTEVAKISTKRCLPLSESSTRTSRTVRSHPLESKQRTPLRRLPGVMEALTNDAEYKQSGLHAEATATSPTSVQSNAYFTPPSSSHSRQSSAWSFTTAKDECGDPTQRKSQPYQLNGEIETTHVMVKTTEHLEESGTGDPFVDSGKRPIQNDAHAHEEPSRLDSMGVIRHQPHINVEADSEKQPALPRPLGPGFRGVTVESVSGVSNTDHSGFSAKASLVHISEDKFDSSRTFTSFPEIVEATNATVRRHTKPPNPECCASEGSTDQIAVDDSSKQCSGTEPFPEFVDDYFAGALGNQQTGLPKKSLELSFKPELHISNAVSGIAKVNEVNNKASTTRRDDAERMNMASPSLRATAPSFVPRRHRSCLPREWRQNSVAAPIDCGSQAEAEDAPPVAELEHQRRLPRKKWVIKRGIYDGFNREDSSAWHTNAGQVDVMCANDWRRVPKLQAPGEAKKPPGHAELYHTADTPQEKPLERRLSVLSKIDGEETAPRNWDSVPYSSSRNALQDNARAEYEAKRLDLSAAPIISYLLKESRREPPWYDKRFDGRAAHNRTTTLPCGRVFDLQVAVEHIGGVCHKCSPDSHWVV